MELASSVRLVALSALIPAAAMVIGGVFAAGCPPGPRLRSVFQHVAAGVVFAAVAGELLPAAKAANAVTGVALGFAISIALMLVIRHLTEQAAETATAGTVPQGFMATVGVDIVIDGLLVGIGFAAGSEDGILVTAALTLEVLFLGLATAAALVGAGASRTFVIGAPLGLAVLLVASAVAGAALLGGLTGGSNAAMLGFGSAALLYLVTEELLVEAHEVPETPTTAATFFVGFLLLLVLELLAAR